MNRCVVWKEVTSKNYHPISICSATLPSGFTVTFPSEVSGELLWREKNKGWTSHSVNLCRPKWKPLLQAYLNSGCQSCFMIKVTSVFVFFTTVTIDHNMKHISFWLNICNILPASRRNGRVETEGLLLSTIYLAFSCTPLLKKKKTSRYRDCEIMYIKNLNKSHLVKGHSALVIVWVALRGLY